MANNTQNGSVEALMHPLYTLSVLWYKGLFSSASTMQTASTLCWRFAWTRSILLSREATRMAISTRWGLRLKEKPPLTQPCQRADEQEQRMMPHRVVGDDKEAAGKEQVGQGSKHRADIGTGKPGDDHVEGGIGRTVAPQRDDTAHAATQ